jgi:hypothetical protein
MQMDRRQVLQGAAAAILGAPVASFAASGDFPKQAFFGSAPISAPFGETYGQAGAPIWEKLQDTERGIYERILTNTKTHLDNVEGFISKPSWDEATSELRLEMGETRKAMVRLSDVADTPVSLMRHSVFAQISVFAHVLNAFPDLNFEQFVDCIFFYFCRRPRSCMVSSRDRSRLSISPFPTRTLISLSVCVLPRTSPTDSGSPLSASKPQLLKT